MLHEKQRVPCRTELLTGRLQRPQPVPAVLPCLPFGIQFPSLKPSKGGSLRDVSSSLFTGCLLRKFIHLLSFSTRTSASAFPHALSHPPLPSAKLQLVLQPPLSVPANSFLGPGLVDLVWFRVSIFSLCLGVTVDVRESTKHSSDPRAPRWGSSFPPRPWRVGAVPCKSVPVSSVPELAP